MFGFFGDVSHDAPYLQLSRSPFIRDLNLENISIRAENLDSTNTNNYIGGLVGKYASLVNMDPRPVISGCSVSGSISCSGYKIQVGGLVGHAVGAFDEDYSIDMINCSAAVDIRGTAQYAGGFVGLCEWKVEILSCSASGNLEISNGESAGGFVGSLSLIGAEKIKIKNCYATGNVQLDTNGDQVQAGGFCGEAYGGTTSPVYYGYMQECMCSGDVTLTGSGTMLLAGGFLGSATPPGLEVSDCYCTGDVTVSGDYYAFGGGFAGNNSSITNRCYASGSVTGTNGSGLSRAFGFSGNGTTSYEDCYALGTTMTSSQTAPFSTGTHQNCFYYGGIDFGESEPVFTTNASSLTAEEIGSGLTALNTSVWMEGNGPLPILTGVPRPVQETAKPSYMILTVTFETQGGSSISPQTAYRGKIFTPPAPNRTGYKFEGWYIDPEGTEPFDLDTAISESVILYAKWTLIINVTDVTLDKTALSLEEGGSAHLTAAVAPEDADDTSVTWTSGDSAVAEVDETGKVTAKKAGTATITVTTTDGGFEASCNVTVVSAPVPVTGVVLDKTILSLGEGGSAQLIASVTPENADDTSVTWTSSDSAVAEVDETDKVTAKSAGTATITVTTADGDFEAFCNVTVVPVAASVTSVALDKTVLSLREGGSARLIASITPEDAGDKSVTWISSDSAVAEVDMTGKVTAKSAGTATITVTTTDGGFEAFCNVTVVSATVSVTGVALDKSGFGGF